jgi:hypothetical protein
MRKIAEMQDFKPIIQKLKDIAAYVFTEGNLRFELQFCAFTCGHVVGCLSDVH